MPAGGSANETARKQRERAARLQRSAELWEQGAAGEVAVARVLESLPDEWVVLHDLAWPGRQRANIDHVVIGPGGVFVIDAKNWSGRIEVRDQVLRQNGRAREQAVASAAEAAIALQGVVPPPAYCMGVLCFVRDDSITGWARDVMVCSTDTLMAMLTSRPLTLSQHDVRRCADAVRLAARRSAKSTRSARARSVVTGPSTERKAVAKRKAGRPFLALIGASALLASLWSGAYQQVADWAGQRLAEVIVRGAPAEPPPTKPAVQEREKQPNKAKERSK